MKRIKLIGIPIIAASIMMGCTDDTPDQVRVCKDQNNKVVPDAQCEPIGRTQQAGGGGVSPVMWWYMGYLNGGYRPGYQISGGSANFTGNPQRGFASNAAALSGSGWSSTGRAFSARSAGFGSTGTAHASSAGA